MPAHINRQVFTIPLLFLLAVSGIACRKKALPLAIPAAPAATTAPVEPMEQPPQQTSVPAQPPATLPQPTVAPPPPEEVSQPKKSARRIPRAATPATPATSPSPNQPLRLGEMLTPEQERQYNAAMDRCLQRAQANISTVLKRQLSKEQQGVVAQVQSFMDQAQSTRKTNLTAAKSLAERADVLARELARTVR
jgi:type IV secretory pathway VirB10-like protein